MIHLDTSLLVDALTGPRASLPALSAAIDARERIAVSTLVLYEWLRGPRRPEELEAQAVICPSAEAASFGHEEAAVAARLYASAKRPRGREVDLAIAACAIAASARLWTLNPEDFADLPGLQLFRPS